MPVQHRRYPLDPPKGKGNKVTEASGVLASARMPVLALLEAAKERYGGLHGNSDSTTPRMSGETGGSGAQPCSSIAGLDFSAMPIRDQQAAATTSAFGYGVRQARLSQLMSIKEAPSDTRRQRAAGDGNQRDGNRQEISLATGV